MKAGNIAIFVGGALIGGSLVYIFLKEKIRRDVERGNTELLDAIQQSMEDRYEAMYNRKEDETKKNEENKSRPDTTPKSSIQKPDPSKTTKVSYNAVKAAADDILSEYNAPFADEEKPTKPVATKGTPYLMCYDDMMEQDAGYNLLVCHFYPEGDGIVTDDYGIPLTDPLNDIGWDNLKYLRDEDKDVIYVRNDYLNLDYEIYLNKDIY